MMIDRAAWADAYNFEVEALKALSAMGQDDFWVWYHTRQAQIIDKHDNNPLIQNLMLAVFEEMEAADNEKHRKGA